VAQLRHQRQQLNGVPSHRKALGRNYNLPLGSTNAKRCEHVDNAR
jgi:hypothetical protein